MNFGVNHDGFVRSYSAQLSRKLGDHLILDALRDSAVAVKDGEHLRVSGSPLFLRVNGELPARYC